MSPLESKCCTVVAESKHGKYPSIKCCQSELGKSEYKVQMSLHVNTLSPTVTIRLLFDNVCNVSLTLIVSIETCKEV